MFLVALDLLLVLYELEMPSLKISESDVNRI